MTRNKAITSLISEQLAVWLAEPDTPTPASINCGYCADFRDGVFHVFKQHAELADIDFDDIYYSDLALQEDRPAPPLGLTWNELGNSAAPGEQPTGLLKWTCHEWMRLDGLHFDSEAPEGVENPFDLPCIRRSLANTLALHYPDLLASLVGHSWWQRSVQMSAENLRWHIRFFDEPIGSSARTMLDVMEKLEGLFDSPKALRRPSSLSM